MTPSSFCSPFPHAHYSGQPGTQSAGLPLCSLRRASSSPLTFPSPSRSSSPNLCRTTRLRFPGNCSIWHCYGQRPSSFSPSDVSISGPTCNTHLGVRFFHTRTKPQPAPPCQELHDLTRSVKLACNHGPSTQRGSRGEIE